MGFWNRSAEKAPRKTKEVIRSREIWEKDNLPVLRDYIRIPNVSQDFEENWQEPMNKAVELLVSYIEDQKSHINGLSYEIVRLPGKAPLIFITAEGTAPEKVLMYGHMDKQPAGGEWRDGLDPWTPIQEGNKLYGRGGADDGYALFSALTSLRMLDEQGIDRPTTQIIIEGAEESGSVGLLDYLEVLGDRIHEPDLIVCLDSETKDYGRLWDTTSLRGLVNFTLEIETGGSAHSGKVGGMTRDAFLASMQLLFNRIVDPDTQAVLLPELQTDISEERIAEAKAIAELLGPRVWEEYNLTGDPLNDDPVEALLNTTWRPSLATVGTSLPPVDKAGNVLHGKVSIKVSVRIPPGVDPLKAAQALEKALTTNPPHKSKVTFTLGQTAEGWIAPPQSNGLKASIQEASKKHMGGEAMTQGTGGSIPFMNALSQKFPRSQFLVTGVLGPESNAHALDESLDTEYVVGLTAALTHILADSGKWHE